MCQSDVSKPTTATQRRVLDAIRKFDSEQGHSPTLRELADSLGREWTTAGEHVQKLNDAGMLQLDARNGRILLHTRCWFCGQALRSQEPLSDDDRSVFDAAS